MTLLLLADAAQGGGPGAGTVTAGVVALLAAVLALLLVLRAPARRRHARLPGATAAEAEHLAWGEAVPGRSTVAVSVVPRRSDRRSEKRGSDTLAEAMSAVHGAELASLLGSEHPVSAPGRHRRPGGLAGAWARLRASLPIIGDDEFAELSGSGPRPERSWGLLRRVPRPVHLARHVADGETPGAGLPGSEVLGDAPGTAPDTGQDTGQDDVRDDVQDDGLDGVPAVARPEELPGPSPEPMLAHDDTQEVLAAPIMNWGATGTGAVGPVAPAEPVAPSIRFELSAPEPSTDEPVLAAPAPTGTPDADLHEPAPTPGAADVTPAGLRRLGGLQRLLSGLRRRGAAEEPEAGADEVEETAAETETVTEAEAENEADATLTEAPVPDEAVPDTAEAAPDEAEDAVPYRPAADPAPAASDALAAALAAALGDDAPVAPPAQPAAPRSRFDVLDDGPAAPMPRPYAPSTPPLGQPAVQRPAAQQPVLREPAVEQLVAEQPAVEQLVAEQAAVEQPAVEQPAVQQPVAEQPAVQEPMLQDPAELPALRAAQPYQGHSPSRVQRRSLRASSRRLAHVWSREQVARIACEDAAELTGATSAALVVRSIEGPRVLWLHPGGPGSPGIWGSSTLEALVALGAPFRELVAGDPLAGGATTSLLTAPVPTAGTMAGALLVRRDDDRGFSPAEEDVLARLARMTGKALLTVAGKGAITPPQDVDPATGLPDRTRLEADLSAALRTGVNHGMPAALLLAEVEGLIRLRTDLGEEPADEAIAAVAQALGRALRVGDVPYRFGRDQLAVLMPATDAAAVRRIGERMRTSVPEALALTEVPGVRDLGVRTTAVPVAGSVKGVIERAEQALLVRRAEQRWQPMTGNPPLDASA